MKILAFDVGKGGNKKNAGTGVALSVDGKIVSSNHFKYKSHKSYYDHVVKIIEHCKPESITTSKPSRFYDTIYAHAQMICLIELAAEQRGISVFLLTDGEIKGWAFPKQKKVAKSEVIAKFGGTTEDEADARMFALYLDSKIEIEK